MTKTKPLTPQTETTRKLFPKSEGWTQPATWEEWDFLLYCNCPEIDKYLAQAPIIDRECPACGAVEQWNAIDAAIMPNGKCDNCIAEYKRQECSGAPGVKHEELLEQLIPPLYRKTDRARLMKETSAEQVRQATAWQMDAEGQGLILVGDTRTGKTRTMCLVVDRLVRYGVKTKTFFHGAFYDELLDVIRSEKNLRRWKKELIEFPLVAIDDLFAEKLTERGEASLFEILDGRICNHRPTLLTTQVTKKEGIKRFHSIKRAEAFFSRINEFFLAVECSKATQANLKI